MFLGHHAVAFAAKRVAPRTSLGMLMGAALLLDLVWPVLVLTGVESFRVEPGNTAFTPLAFDSYPFSHSLLTSLGIAVLLAIAYWSFARYQPGAWMVGLGVFSHWVLDFISHRPDLPLAPGGEARVGLGLWNSIPATLAVELVLFGVAVWIYLRTTRPREMAGRVAPWILVGFLLATYFANAFGPPPPSAHAVSWVALAVWLLPFWAAWMDRRREVPAPKA